MLESDCKDITWHGIHVFFNGNIYSVDGDRIINKVISPFIFFCKGNKLIEKYFLIRYNELGPHLRFRLLSTKQTFDNKILPSFHEHISISFPEDLNPLIKNYEEEAKRYLIIEYQPELERYGGTEAVKIAEDYFFNSSEVVLKLLAANQNMEHSARLAKGLIAMLVMLYVFTTDKNIASNIMNNYNNNYLHIIAREEKIIEAWNNAFKNGVDRQEEYLDSVIDNVWTSMEENEILTSPWGEFQLNVIKVKNELSGLFDKGKISFNNFAPINLELAIQRIVPSYIHMMNNRLGIPIADESYLAFLIRYSLTKQIKVM